MVVKYLMDCVQGSEAWRQARCGRVTSSGAENVLPMRDLRPPAKGEGRDNDKGRTKYALQLALERVTQRADPDVFKGTDAMARGTRLEPEARAAYAARHPEVELRECGFVEDQERLLGDSPDGLAYIGGEVPVGGLECKCPNQETHLEYVEGGVVPATYLRQMLHHLHLNPTAEWWDFVSYHPAFPECSQVFEVRLTRADAQPLLDIYAGALDRFLVLVDEAEARVRALDTGRALG